MSCIFLNITWHVGRGDIDSNCVRASGHVNVHTCHCFNFFGVVDITIEVCQTR